MDSGMTNARVEQIENEKEISFFSNLLKNPEFSLNRTQLSIKMEENLSSVTEHNFLRL